MELTIETAEACLRDPAYQPLLRALIECGRIAGTLTARDLLLLLKEVERRAAFLDEAGLTHVEDDLIIAIDARKKARNHRLAVQRAEAREDPWVHRRERDNDRRASKARRKRKRQERLREASRARRVQLEADRKARKSAFAVIRAGGAGLRKCGAKVESQSDLRDTNAQSRDPRLVG